MSCWRHLGDLAAPRSFEVFDLESLLIRLCVKGFSGTVSDATSLLPESFSIDAIMKLISQVFFFFLQIFLTDNYWLWIFLYRFYGISQAYGYENVPKVLETREFFPFFFFIS